MASVEPYFIIAFTNIFLILFTIFVILKVDGDIKWSWYGVFAPFWASFIPYTWFNSYIFHNFIYKRASALGGAFWIFCTGICFLLFSILLPLKLEEQRHWKNVSWVAIFVPFWVGLSFLSLVDSNWPEWHHKFHKMRGSNYWKRFTSTLPLNGILAFVVFTIILVISLDNRTDALQCTGSNWWYCFSPFWYFTGAFILILITNLSEFDDLFSGVLIPFIFGLIFIAFEILLVLFLSGTIDRLIYAGIPLFILEVIFCGMSCFLPCCL